MKALRILSTVAAAATLALTAASAPLGSPSKFFRVDGAEFSPQEHWELLDTVQEIGVSVHINDLVACNDSGASGLYFTGLKELHVCQDNRNGGSEEQVEWTANDFDTIRHEVHHIVQDLQDGRLGDRRLHPVFVNQQQFEALLAEALTQEQIDNIARHYGGKGLDDRGVRMELEAFAVAALIPPAQLEQALINLSQ